MRPRNGVWAFGNCSRNIRNDPEKIPIMDPINPSTVSKFLEITFVLFMVISICYYIIYFSTGRLSPAIASRFAF